MRFLFVRPEVCPWLVSLPHPASFRFHLAMDTLAFDYLLPAAGWIRVFHPLETCAAGRTKHKACPSAAIGSPGRLFQEPPPQGWHPTAGLADAGRAQEAIMRAARSGRVILFFGYPSIKKEWTMVSMCSR